MALEVEESEDGEVEIRATSSKRKRNGKKEEEESAPIENDEVIPLFPNHDKTKENLIALIRVMKRDPPGDGYKGDIHPTASLDFVAKRWGNGIYDFHAMNSEHKVLRRSENVTISSLPKQTPALPADVSSTAAERLLERQAAGFDRDQDRAYRISTQAIESTSAQAKSYAEMIRADTEARVQRDREFFAQQQTAQREAHQQMMQQTQQMHRMTMEQQTAGFTQVLTMMTAMHEREMATNNPMVLIEVLRQGFQMGADGAGADMDPLTVAMQTGLGGLKEVTKMMALQKGIKSPKLPKPGASAKGQTPSNQGEKPNPAISRDELQEILAIKRLAEKKGYDFEGILSQAKTMVIVAPDQNDESTDDSDNDDSGESGSAPVDGGKSS